MPSQTRTPRQYDVDGELQTAQQLADKAGIPLGTMRKRLSKGQRNWLALSEDPAKATARVRAAMKQRMAMEREWRQSERERADSVRMRAEATESRGKGGQAIKGPAKMPRPR